MPSAAAAAAGSSSLRRQHLSCYPPWILLNASIHVESHLDSTTAALTKTSNNLTIEASCYPAQPPLRSKFFVFCHDSNICEDAKILTCAEDLLMFRVTTTIRGYCDYFIYRAGIRPSLYLIPHLMFNFGERFVSLLPRGRDHYTVASLLSITTNEFKICRFNSEDGSWTSKLVSLETPPRAFPVEIPRNVNRLKHHRTTTVVTLGGETGTVGWVDLWRGIMVCDLLSEDQDKPTIRHLPLPLPMDAITCNNGMGTELGYPVSSRGIAACIKCGKPVLKFAELKVTSERLTYTDDETEWPTFRVDDWTITTWTNTKMAGSYEDWEETFTVLASKIKISNSLCSELQTSGLLQHKLPLDGEEALVDLGLQHIVVYEPRPSLNGEDDVVYLMARARFMHPKAYALAVDMKKSELLGVSEFSTGRRSHSVLTYHIGAISKYMNPATAPGTSGTRTGGDPMWGMGDWSRPPTAWKLHWSKRWRRREEEEEEETGEKEMKIEEEEEDGKPPYERTPALFL